MITKNTNILFLLFPATYLPLALAGTFYANGDYTNVPYILYALMPFGISILLTITAYFANKSGNKKGFVERCSLARFAVTSFVMYVVSLLLASILILIIRGASNLPFVLGTWMILLTIFCVYQFCWLYLVYLILYKNNIDFL